ncbi:hypothetical protein DSO57_1010495 [Entomophthora muscae]|uniref:Uncharacterized protein n=1 Tax=Entomophthora muscae TaxID=34485 RepID=A0ACC2SJL4_9FUNG|nr:hypothetical protein DSO57_1010495 [Entomophthora muscae]
MSKDFYISPTVLVTVHGPLGKVKVRNSTYTDASFIMQPITFDLEGSPFRINCNSTPNLSYPVILGFPWLKKCFLNFDHSNNRVTFTCNNALCSAPLNTDLSLSSPACFQLTLLAISPNESMMHTNSDRIPLCYSNFKDCFSKSECYSLPPIALTTSGLISSLVPLLLWED